MNFTDKSDWYLITTKKIKNPGGSGLLGNIMNHYNMHLNQFIQIMNGFHGYFKVQRFLGRY